MTQDSSSSVQVPWGQRPAPPPDPAWWHGVLTVPGLLTHLIIMLSVASALTVINMLTGPRVWWSLAILVVWLALVIIHAIGVGSRTLLFMDDDVTMARPVRRPPADPVGPAIPAWLSLPKRATNQEPIVPESWELPDNPDPAWNASPPTTAEAPAAPEPVQDKVPWRAATDIAWLRRPKTDASSDTEPPSSKTASS